MRMSDDLGEGMSVTLLPTAAVGTDEAVPTAVGTEPAAWATEAKRLLGEADSSYDQAVSTLANAFNRYEAIQTILKRAKAEAEAAGRRLSNREIARQLKGIDTDICIDERLALCPGYVADGTPLGIKIEPWSWQRG